MCADAQSCGLYVYADDFKASALSMPSKPSTPLSEVFRVWIGVRMAFWVAHACPQRKDADSSFGHDAMIGCVHETITDADARSVVSPQGWATLCGLLVLLYDAVQGIGIERARFLEEGIGSGHEAIKLIELQASALPSWRQR